MKQLSQMIKPQYNESGKVYYACNVTKPVLEPVSIRLTSPSEIYNADAFFNKEPELYAVISTGDIPKASKFKTIRTTNTIVFDTEEECQKYFNEYISTEIVNNTKVYTELKRVI